jgi:hypothetical protein
MTSANRRKVWRNDARTHAHTNTYLTALTTSCQMTRFKQILILVCLTDWTWLNIMFSSFAWSLYGKFLCYNQMSIPCSDVLVTGLRVRHVGRCSLDRSPCQYVLNKSKSWLQYPIWLEFSNSFQANWNLLHALQQCILPCVALWSHIN